MITWRCGQTGSYQADCGSYFCRRMVIERKRHQVAYANGFGNRTSCQGSTPLFDDRLISHTAGYLFSTSATLIRVPRKVGSSWERGWGRLRCKRPNVFVSMNYFLIGSLLSACHSFLMRFSKSSGSLSVDFASIVMVSIVFHLI